MTAPEQPTPTTAAMALAGRYANSADEWHLALAIDELAAQRATEAVERAERVGRGLELNDAACFLEGWAEKGPPGWRPAARTLAQHIRNGAHRDSATSAIPPPGDAGERAREMVARWEHGSDEHRQWLRDMCVPEIAAALQSERTAAASQARRETLTHISNECDRIKDTFPGYEKHGLYDPADARTVWHCACDRVRATILANPQESAS